MEKRLMRLTWNSNNWEYPSGHTWKKENQENSNIAFENQFGFGYEEWLFSPQFQIDGYQYGYIRGVEKLKTELEIVDELVLYSINPHNKNRELVAIIKNMEIIVGYENMLKTVRPIFNKHQNNCVEELKEVEADFSILSKNPILPNVRFKLVDIQRFENVLVNGISGSRFNRFMPYKIDDEVSLLLKLDEINNKGFVFVSGKVKMVKSFKKKTLTKQGTINRTHTEIGEDLYDYLKKIKKDDENNLSLEKSRVANKLIDLVVDSKDGYSIFEIKTNTNAKQNIREAIGQLLEYAFSDVNTKIVSLNIVGPAKLNASDIAYLNSLREAIFVELNYLYYDKNQKDLSNRFIHY